MASHATFILSRLASALAWVPSWLPGVVLLLAAVLIALAAHSTIFRLVLTLSGGRVMLQNIVKRTRRAIRVALVVIALGVVVPATGFPLTLVGGIERVLLVVAILLIGWAVMIAVEVGSDLYLRPYRIDVADNLMARKHITQVRVLRRAVNTLIAVVTISVALMTFPMIRQYGISLFASAGAAGLVVGLAARPLLSNLIAGVQIAVTQPIRLEDAVIVAGEWGWIEEITSTYVVIRIWDWRRLIVPLSYFIENPFQNWTRESGALIGSVHLFVDYTVPIATLRSKVEEFAKESRLWDGQVVNLQVVEATQNAVQLRILASARTSPETWDLRCEIREKVIGYLQREFPGALPRLRAEMNQPQPAVS
ncbi:MAG: mechanosensitive ion channel family protein [Acetobacteraceae bacterium]